MPLHAQRMRWYFYGLSGVIASSFVHCSDSWVPAMTAGDFVTPLYILGFCVWVTSTHPPVWLTPAQYLAIPLDRLLERSYLTAAPSATSPLCMPLFYCDAASSPYRYVVAAHRPTGFRNCVLRAAQDRVPTQRRAMPHLPLFTSGRVPPSLLLFRRNVPARKHRLLRMPPCGCTDANALFYV